MNERSVSCKMISQHFQITHMLAHPDIFFLFRRGKEPESGFVPPAVAHCSVPCSAFTRAALRTAAARHAGHSEV